LDFGFWILIESKISTASCLYYGIGGKELRALQNLKFGRFWILDFGLNLKSIVLRAYTMPLAAKEVRPLQNLKF